MSEVKIEYLGELSTRCVLQDTAAEIITDAPKDNFGRGEMFSPTDLVATALGSCILTLIGIVAKKLSVDVSDMSAVVQKEMAAKPQRRIGKIVVTVVCPRDFSEDVKQKLEKAGRECPVHHSLHPEIEQEIHFIWGSKS